MAPTPATTSSPRSALLLVLAALLLGAGFLAWVDAGRRERVEYVTRLAADEAAVDPASPTGWAGGRRWLIASEHNNSSYQWILETQQMLATGDWRLRRVGYDNAPDTREVATAAPYRWWLAGVARVIQSATGVPAPLAVERAALHADPALRALALLVLAALAGAAWGARPAAVVLVTGALLYPFSASFAPGAPDDLTLSLAAGAASVLALAAALWHQADAARARRWAVIAGLAGGFGLWVNAFAQAPVLLGLAFAGGVAGLVRTADTYAARVWRVWGAAGAVAGLAGFALEYLPAWPGVEIRANHPWLALAWLGAGEALAALVAVRASGPKAAGRTTWVRGGLGLAAVAAVLVLVFRSEVPWVQGREVFGTRLTSLPLAGAAPGFGAWLSAEGLSLQVLAVLAPLGVLVIPAWLAWRGPAAPAARQALVVTLVPLAVVLPLAWVQLRWWSMADALVLAAVAASGAVLAPAARAAAARWAAAGLACGLLPGLLYQRPAPRAVYEKELTQFEAESIVERSLAHWLAAHAAVPPQVLAPPFRTTALSFFGNFRGLGSLAWENKDAMNAAARIAAATSPDEALALMNKRGITHVIIPSWDGYLDEYARILTSRPENSFIHALKQWQPPPWLKPVAYQLPEIGGFDGQSVVLYEMVEEQDLGTTLGRLVEYFIEMGQLDIAAAAARSLDSYPGNLAAQVARAQFHASRGDRAQFGAALGALRAIYDASEEHDLAWDRRVSLAVVLMQAGQGELARREMEICLNLADEAKLRSLSVGSLYRFQVLLRALQLRIEDPKLAALAPALLPPSLRARL